MPDSDNFEIAGMTGEILSTADQLEQELLAARIFRQNSMQKAIGALEVVARAYPQYEREAGATTWRRALEELAFAYVNKTVNLEGHRPRILWDQNVPVRRGDVLIPGSRSYGNNPDNIYRRIPLDPAGRYLLRGRLGRPAAADVSFSVLPSYRVEHGWRPVTVDPALLADADGWFELTLDATDGDGSPRHMQLAEQAERLTVRDSMKHWDREVPMKLEIRRFDHPDAPQAEPDAEKIANRLALHLHDYLHHHIKLTKPIMYAREPNELRTPGVGPSGGLLTQALSNGWFSIEEDEALLLEISQMGARYLATQVWDPWMFARNYWDQTGSLNDAQAVADGDGWFRLAIAKHDPGLHNWLDTDGLLEGGVAIRWQGLPDGVSTLGECLRVRRLPMARLRSELPADTKWVGPAERQAQRTARKAAHAHRFTL